MNRNVRKINTFVWDRTGEYSKFREMSDSDVLDMLVHDVSETDQELATDEYVNRQIAKDYKVYGYENILVIHNDNQEAVRKA